MEEHRIEHVDGLDVHHGIGCDVCGDVPIIGRRYKCSVCSPSYDLCQCCKDGGGSHTEHTMIEIRRRDDMEMTSPSDISCIFEDLFLTGMRANIKQQSHLNSLSDGLKLTGILQEKQENETMAIAMISEDTVEHGESGLNIFYTCDVCNTNIRGTRYHCTVCLDFDLCRSCRLSGNHLWHRHKMIKFESKSQRKACLSEEQRPQIDRKDITEYNERLNIKRSDRTVYKEPLSLPLSSHLTDKQDYFSPPPNLTDYQNHASSLSPISHFSDYKERALPLSPPSHLTDYQDHDSTPSYWTDFYDHLSLPSYWTEFHNGKTLREWNIHVLNKPEIYRKINVQRNSKEYRLIEKVVHKTWQPNLFLMGRDAKGLQQLGYKNIEVEKIERIENPELFERYAQERARLVNKFMKVGPFTKLEYMPKSERGQILTSTYFDNNSDMYSDINECYLFHGTLAERIDVIAVQGLDCRLTEKAMFGSGIYCAESTTKSDQYSDSPRTRTKDDKKCMLLVRTCLGEIYVDESDQGKEWKRPPCKTCYQDSCTNPQHDISNTGFFDSIVNDSKLIFREFIVYSRERCYPEYIITYRRT